MSVRTFRRINHMMMMMM